MISLSVGLTAVQSQGGADLRLSKWLSNLNNIRRALAVAGADDLLTGSNAVVKWLQQPKVIPGTPVTEPEGGSVSKDVQLAVGLAVGLGGAVVVLGVVWAVLRRRRKRREEEEEKEARVGGGGGLVGRGSGSGDNAAERRRVSGGGAMDEGGRKGAGEGLERLGEGAEEGPG